MARTRVFVVVVCGSRTWDDEAAIRAAVEELVRQEPFLLVVTGGAAGADTIADEVARKLGAHTAVIRALWAKGRNAGPVRNQVMVDLFPNMVLAFRRRGPSSGTDDMVRRAVEARAFVTVFHEGGVIQRFRPKGAPSADA